MTTREQLWVWAGIIVAALLCLWLVADILLPFVLGAAIAYFLDPLADRLERLGLSRFLATLIILVTAGLTVLLMLLLLLPPLIEQAAGFLSKVPGYIAYLRELAQSQGEKWFGDLAARSPQRFDETLTQVTQKAASFVGQIATSLLSGGLAFVNFAALFLVTPVVAFYLLLDWDRMVQSVDKWLPRRQAPTIRGLAAEMNEVISGFVRGQFTVLMILTVFYIVALSLLGLNFGLLIGLGAGLISFIPYVGPLAGFLIGGTVAVVQHWPEWWPILAVLGVFVTGQLVEGNVLSPMIVGDRVKLHPVWLMFALFVFGYLFGFVGMLIAVPMAAVIGVLVRFGLKTYQESAVYDG
ncbi:MAG: AI-2E family transporter [Pseudomonadota bacterium]|nr:AI-2E family transporter [Pseudomonadota bacterium]